MVLKKKLSVYSIHNIERGSIVVVNPGRLSVLNNKTEYSNLETLVNGIYNFV